jgi:ABC-2 type transport system permease protein
MPKAASERAVQMLKTDTLPRPGARRFGPVNWLGLWTLYEKESRRFLKIPSQTILAPVITNLMFLFVFAVAMGKRPIAVGGAAVPFSAFMASGLIMMAIQQSAFAHSSSSLLSAKVQGNIVDVLMPPLSPAELTTAFAGGALTRGICVAIASWIALSFGAWAAGAAPLGVAHLVAILYFGCAASLFMSLAGILCGIWAQKFDHLAVVTNFLITPLTFLSGTFYSVGRLPEPFKTIDQYNPLFHAIDGFRYGVLGIHESNLAAGAIGLLAINLLLGFTCWLAFRRGWRMKP